jgi:L-iditol 2-dehydrogenase
MKAAVYHPHNGIKVEDKPVPKIGEGEILLKVRACGICGTDVLKVQRALPKAPVVLGHELVGEAVEVGKGVKKFSRGDRIVVAHHVPCGQCHYCRHDNPSMCRHFKETNLDPGGFAEFLRIPAEHVQHTAFPVPEHVEEEVALFTEPLSCCVRNIRRAPIQTGDFSVVVGLGSIGLMMLQLLKLKGLSVLGLDLKKERLNLAEELGCDFTLFGNDPDLYNKIQEWTDRRGADLVVLTAGGGRVFKESMEWVRDGGALNLFASLADEPVPTSLDRLYHHEITIFSSYSPALQDLTEAHRLLISGQVKVKPLVTHRLPLEKLAQGIELVQRQEALKVIIEPHG